ncbi:TNF receptor-associated factor 5-like isoform X1 [Halichondria panicea]|uniref:TNF receptor-associated factor 5-like isoform X2 n=1 Tax=Halichondria panicea TaxID=6063 RepID=UPI00312B6CBD
MFLMMAQANQEPSESYSPRANEAQCPDNDTEFVSEVPLQASVQATDDGGSSAAVYPSLRQPTTECPHLNPHALVVQSLGISTSMQLVDSSVQFVDCFPFPDTDFPLSVEESQEGISGASRIVVSTGFTFNYEQVKFQERHVWVSKDQMHHITTDQPMEDQPMEVQPMEDQPMEDQPMEDQPSPSSHTCTGELELKAVTSNGTVIWKIPDITRQRSEAIEGKTQCLYSPYFYTVCGCKVCLRLYLNGDGMGKGTHISLFIDCDKLPFKRKISLTLIDQKQIKHPISQVLKPPAPQMDNSQSEMNIASGFPMFAKQAALDSNSYLHNDCMYLKCSAS